MLEHIEANLYSAYITHTYSIDLQNSCTIDARNYITCAKYYNFYFNVNVSYKLGWKSQKVTQQSTAQNQNVLATY